MPIAEIITIGTEILLGEIFDTNSRYLALEFRQNGIDLFRIQSIGDNVERIAKLIKESLTRADIVIATGGLGPTVDDPTRLASARAFNTDLVFHQELYDAIEKRMRVFGRSMSENQKVQAFIPACAEAIHNPIGTAPAFYVRSGKKIFISLPGVPSEMEFLWKNAVLPLLKVNFDLTSRIYVRKLKTYGIGEGKIDEYIAEFERAKNPTVGLSAHFGFVEIRLTAKHNDEAVALTMLDDLEREIRGALPPIIFGVDETHITSSIESSLSKITTPVMIAIDPDSATLMRFKDVNPITYFVVSDHVDANFDTPLLIITQDPEQGVINLVADMHGNRKNYQRTFAGNPDHYDDWANNILLGELWRGIQLILSTEN